MSDLPPCVAEGKLIYDDPARSVWFYEGEFWLADPQVPDGGRIGHLPPEYVVEFFEGVLRELRDRGMSLRLDLL